MAINHDIMRWVVALAFGFAVAWYSYQRITDPEPAARRALEESVVVAARAVLVDYLGAEAGPEFVDPLSPDRKVGKVFVFPANGGWEVSGYYRRDGERRWHPFLMALDDERQLVSLSVRDADPGLVTRAAGDPRLTVTPASP